MVVVVLPYDRRDACAHKEMKCWRKKGLWSRRVFGHMSTGIRREGGIPVCSSLAIEPVLTGKPGLLLIKELLIIMSKPKRCPPLRKRRYMSSVHFLA